MKKLKNKIKKYSKKLLQIIILVLICIVMLQLLDKEGYVSKLMPNFKLSSKDDSMINRVAIQSDPIISEIFKLKTEEVSPVVIEPVDINNSRIKFELENYLNKLEGKYGIYYYNLINHQEFGINHQEEFVAASTIKIPLNLYLYTKISSGEIDPKNTLTYLKGDYEAGTGILQNKGFGGNYAIDELSKLSITLSDNVATNILFRHLDKLKVKEYMREIGGEVVNNNKNITSPKDMGLYMRLVYSFWENEGKCGKELMDSFLNTEFNDRLPALLPKTVKVAHKIGTQTTEVHDVGVVFAKEPYVLSVMSKEVNEKEATAHIAKISKMIYSYFDN